MMYRFWTWFIQASHVSRFWGSFIVTGLPFTSVYHITYSQTNRVIGNVNENKFIIITTLPILRLIIITLLLGLPFTYGSILQSFPSHPSAQGFSCGSNGERGDGVSGTWGKAGKRTAQGGRWWGDEGRDTCIIYIYIYIYLFTSCA